MESLVSPGWWSFMTVKRNIIGFIVNWNSSFPRCHKTLDVSHLICNIKPELLPHNHMPGAAQPLVQLRLEWQHYQDPLNLSASLPPSPRRRSPCSPSGIFLAPWWPLLWFPPGVKTGLRFSTPVPAHLVWPRDWGLDLDGPGERSVESVGVGHVLVDPRNEAVTVPPSFVPARYLIIDQIVIRQGKFSSEIYWKERGSLQQYSRHIIHRRLTLVCLGQLYWFFIGETCGNRITVRTKPHRVR